MKLKKFVISDEGLPCVNTVEKVYLGLLVTVFALGILSLFRLSYFKAEIRKIFDPRLGFTNINSLVLFTIIFNFKILACESLIKDLNGTELIPWKKLKPQSWTTFMEKTANANLILKAISNVTANGIRNLP